ncbi:serA, partial [Symbiodinium sp. CCMP2456]
MFLSSEGSGLVSGGLDSKDFVKLCREIGREDVDLQEIDVRRQYRQVQDRTAGPQNGSPLERAMPDLLRLPSFDRILSCESLDSLESFHSMRVHRWADRGHFNATTYDDDDDSMTSRPRD